MREQTKRAESMEENLADYENTILQFRELVLNLQTCVLIFSRRAQTSSLSLPRSDLETMREKQNVQQSESQSLASQTQAMLNLNLKLQSSSLKGQVKAIDLELRKLESAQALLHINVVRVGRRSHDSTLARCRFRLNLAPTAVPSPGLY